MRKKWMKIVPQIINNIENIKQINQIKCPNCGKNGIDYIYIGDEKTRLGYFQVWCNECLKGIYISRVLAPQNAKFITFDDNLHGIVPNFEFVED